MREYSGLTLHVRLKNCLQTILELEPELEQLDMGNLLLKEYHQLRLFCERIAEVPLSEQDVKRIETATACFLDELREPLSCLTSAGSKRRMLQ